MLVDLGRISLRTVPRSRRYPLTVVASVLVIVGLTALAVAADASKWDGNDRSAVRLIAGAYVGTGSTRIGRAGIEIKLGDGWKMYWRHPGEAGIPPSLDFSGSTNITEVGVMWPAPQRVTEKGTHLIVYKDRIVLPLRVVPRNAAEPVTLRLKLVYGICEKFCILVDAQSELHLTDGPSNHEPAIAAAEARVPRKVQIGEGGILSIREVRRETGPPGPRMIIEVAASTLSNVDLFAEGPGYDWAPPLPQPISAEGDLRRFSLDLSGIPSGMGSSSSGIMLRLTATADGEAIEVSVPAQ